MKLGYKFINLEAIREMFNEAKQAGKTLTPAQAAETLGAGMPLMLGRAGNAMLDVELDGPEETIRDLMKNIETYLSSKEWINTEAEG